MYNGENQINFPNDKYIKNFIWSDYFHDSKIKTIQFNNSKRKDYYRPDQVVLTMECSREIEWEKLKGTDSQKKTYISENRDKYTYNLYFCDCKYFNCEKSIIGNDYINGRFKNTAVLQKIIKSANKPYYHLRIQIDDGYMDIIFSKFKIKKLKGRIRIRDFEIEYYNLQWLEKHKDGILLSENGELNKTELLELLSSGDDVERYYSLYYFMMYTNEIIVDYARNIMSLDWNEFEMSKIMAISAIGMQGVKEDLAILFNEYFSIEERLSKNSVCYGSILLPKRNIMDAIEKIKYREYGDYNLNL